MNVINLTITSTLKNPHLTFNKKKYHKNIVFGFKKTDALAIFRLKRKHVEIRKIYIEKCDHSNSESTMVDKSTEVCLQ